jgi:hypothetical protein
MDPVLAIIESEVVSSAYTGKERAAMRRATLEPRLPLSLWDKGTALLPGDASEFRMERTSWRQDVLMLAAVLAGAGAFFGPFNLSDLRSRIFLAAIAGALLLARSGRSLIDKLRARAAFRYDHNMGLFQGAIVRRVAAGFSKVVNANDGLGWLTQGIAGQDKGVTEFNTRFNPALSDAQDLVAVILSHPARTHDEARLQATALSHSIARMHAIVADAVSLAYKGEPAAPERRTQAHHAYRLWQAFLDEYREIVEAISKQTDARMLPLWMGGPLIPPASLPSFR